MTTTEADKTIFEVPVVDIGALMTLKDDASAVAELREDNPEIADLIANMRDAAARWGFFYVSNHGVSEKELEEFRAATRDFFALPKDIKNALRRHKNNARGYFDSEVTQNKVDWREVFDVGGRKEDSPPEQSVFKRLRHDQNQWPSEEVLPGFRETVTTNFDRLEHIGRRLTQVFAVALGESADFFDPFFHKLAQSGDGAAKIANNTCQMRLNYYPVSPDPDDTMGVSPHRDGCVLTVLLPDEEVASLQVFDRVREQWTTVPPKKGAFVINTGDMMQVWSNDKFLAPLHRVLSSNSSGRYSVPLLYNPSLSTNIEPIVVHEGDTPHYRPINWGEYRAKRDAGNDENLGEEIQITHYRIEP